MKYPGVRVNGEITKEFRRYDNMIARCFRKHLNKSYGKYYRGITCPKKWRTFSGFWDDMGGTYFEGASLDRIDNHKDYSKENCRWVHLYEQNANKRNVIGRALPIGVYKNKDSKGYYAKIKHDRRQVWLGSFNSVADAETKFREAHAKIHKVRVLMGDDLA